MRLLFIIIGWLFAGALPSFALSLSLSHAPQEGEVVKVARPSLTVYLPLGSNLPHSESQMWLDGREVSESLHRTSAFVSFQPTQDLAAGDHAVKVVIGKNEINWSFRIELPKPRIERVSWTGPKNLQDFDEIAVLLEGRAGYQASFKIDGLTQPMAMKEVQPGQYRGSYTVPANVLKVTARVVGQLAGPGFEETRAAEAPLRFSTAGFRVQLIAPEQGELKGDLHLQGRTRPNVTVNVTAQLEYADGIEVVSDKTGPLPKIAPMKLRSDATGHFRLDIPRPPHKPRLILNLSLEAFDEQDNRSEPLLLHYRMLEKVLPGRSYPKFD